ncbi:hypothetical protein EVB41_052 [Rhizobium phage RHph_TM3_14A]|nr:hypothetical protein EVB29_052 [Rhizobium phage RHph_TM27A]QIG66972.1 hypothetical protein EVB30_052 [Rhizobium phage RHph_TM27B]QIG67061.1 hypothetical protein EVB31_051 [Rhizobium phage RHph_TM29]QIG67517.1 hypothetical protein EVB41_052 [Rhizobium phage RHph_TM3_14A]
MQAWRDYSKTPEKRFLLGFEGEAWNTQLEALKVPIPGTDRNILVTREGNDFFIVAGVEGSPHWTKFDSLLMAAAFVRNYLDEHNAVQ